MLRQQLLAPAPSEIVSNSVQQADVVAPPTDWIPRELKYPDPDPVPHQLDPSIFMFFFYVNATTVMELEWTPKIMQLFLKSELFPKLFPYPMLLLKSSDLAAGIAHDIFIALQPGQTKGCLLYRGTQIAVKFSLLAKNVAQLAAPPAAARLLSMDISNLDVLAKGFYKFCEKPMTNKIKIVAGLGEALEMCDSFCKDQEINGKACYK